MKIGKYRGEKAVTLDIVMIVAILVLSISIYVVFKKSDWNISDWKFILIILLFLIICVLVVFNILAGNNEKAEVIRNISTTLAVIVAAMSFIMTVFFTNRTSETNKQNQESNFIMDLMKNHYTLLISKQDKIDQLIVELEKKFTGNGYKLDKAVQLFQDYLVGGNAIYLQQDISQARTVYGTGKQGKSETALKGLEGILNKDNSDTVRRLLISYYSDSEIYNDFYKNLNQTDLNKKYEDELIRILKDAGLFSKIDMFMQLRSQDIESEITYKEVCEVCNKVFSDMYHEIGHFFRNSYRIVKLINSSFNKDTNIRKNYSGILRSMYSENTILAIYYNCVFTDKGIGFAQQLVNSDFFGSEKDLEREDPIHFRKEKLIFKQIDLRILKTVFAMNSSKTKKDFSEDELLNILKKAFHS